MWFTGHDGTKRAIGYATSVDGISWNWYQGNPVMEGDTGDWDEETAHCNVIEQNGIYLMWYAGFNGDTSAIGFAQSSNGINWDKYNGNPVLTAEPNSWEQLAVDEPHVFYDSNYLHMWYSGLSSENHSQIGLASEITIDVNNNTFAIPEEFKLYQNYPNPFNPNTKIKFTIPTSPLNPSPYQGEGDRERLVTLKVYDVLGNEVATLVKEQLPAGEYEIEFGGNLINQVPTSGVYFYQLQAGEFVQVKKMVLIK
jgi:hypothetical protein